MNIYLGKEADWNTNEKITVEEFNDGLKFSNGFTIEDDHDQD